MEDPQLNFNQPFLTVRRFSPTAASTDAANKKGTDKLQLKVPPLPPRYKSELKSGPVRNPGTVPFVWEQSPGRPKDEAGLQNQTPECLPSTPKLPPGRIIKVKEQDPGKVSHSVTGSQSQIRNDYPSAENEITEDKGTSCSDNGDENYLDARDTFSRSDSFFLNCSVSGLSGADGSDMRTSGRFSREPPARDLMLDRFLPAAKAMAAEAPPHIIRKQHIAQEQPRHQVKKTVDGNENRRRVEVLTKNALSGMQGKFEEESEDDDGGYCEYDNSEAKLCGLFPRLCLLNPLPGMKTQTMRPTSMRGVQVNSTHARHRGETMKHEKETLHKQRPVGGCPRGELHESRFDLKTITYQATQRGDEKTLEGSSLYRRLEGNGRFQGQKQKEFSSSITQREQKSIGPRQNFNNSEVDRSNYQGKQFSNLRELLACEGAEWESPNTVPVVEKTLYVDFEQLVKSEELPTSFSDAEDIAFCEGNVLETGAAGKKVEETALVDSSMLYTENFDPAKKRIVSAPKHVHFVDSPLMSSSDISAHEKQIDMKNCSSHNQDLGLASTKENSARVDGDYKIDLESEAILRSGDGVNLPGAFLDFPPPPPLPKSPSDSWLSRTLPSVSSKKSSSRSPLGTNFVNTVHASESPPIDPKWETIVKASKNHHEHLRFSEELLTPIPES